MSANIIFTPAIVRRNLADVIPLPAPWSIDIEPSAGCNLKCWFCLQATVYAPNPGLMSADTFAAVVNQLKQLPTPPRVMRLLGNGEPLLNSMTVDWAAELAQIGRTELISNGLLLTEDKCDKLAKVCSRICIAIKGRDAAEYEKNTGVAIDYDRLHRMVSYLYQHRGSCQLLLQAQDGWAGDPEGYKAFVERWGGICDGLSVEHLIPIWPGTGLCDGAEHNRYNDAPPVAKLVCPQLWKQFKILSNGDVLPCPADWRRELTLGNVNDTTLADMWRGDYLQMIRNVHLAGKRRTLTGCADCRFPDYCDTDNIDSLLQ